MQGSSRALNEKFGFHSDGFEVYICNNCGFYAIVNEKGDNQIFDCKTCGDKADIRKVRSGWASKILFQEQTGMQLKVQFGLKDHTFDQYV